MTRADYSYRYTYRMRDWPRLESGQVAERPELSQSASTAPTMDRMTELENPLGIFRGRSVETSPGVRGMSRAAGHRLLPNEYRQLAKGAQENAPQHSDASPSPCVSATPLHPSKEK
jgi:hypothetical protein